MTFIESTRLIMAFSIGTFTTFFPMVDPLGNIPIFNSLTQDLTEDAKRYMARKACLIAMCLALLFGFLGEYIFEVFHLTIDGLKVVGGIIFCLVGFDMLNARISRLKIASSQVEERQQMDDIAVSPLAVPLLVGPGTITNCIILMDKAGQDWGLKLAFSLGVIGIFSFTWMCFYWSSALTRLLGHSGNRIILRIMGLFLMIISVNYFFEGITPLVRKIFDIKPM